ncbi:MAG: CBS domain-containing protein, partial [Candidatus Aerophobetes bacterium]|nr:CBS domain-containing protein [Candidatus Aerophobetes bacterium]
DEFIGGFSLPLHKFIDLKNLEVVFALIKSKERIYLIARSRTSSVNVGQILSFFGGGGHNFAASALIKEADSKEIEEKLYRVLEKEVKPHLTVGEVISPPEKTISPYASVREAEDILEKYDLETLPVIDKGKVVGVISRERIERLISHNTENTPLKNYISQKVATIPSFFSIKKAQEVMIEQEVKDLVVFNGEDRFAGVLSGPDLLNAFHFQKKDLREYEEEDNLEKLLKEMAPPKIQDLLRRAGRIAQELGYRAFIVGGFVRDLLLRIENLDIDLVIEGDGISFAKAFAQEMRGEVKYHKDFGTATIILPDGFKLDIATSRREFYPAPAALPVVESAPLREDLLRRDFTVNAMAINLTPSSFGQLIDFFKGREALRQKRVRVLHSESFIQDPTRIFRAVRFEQRYRFVLEEKTQKLIKDALKKGVLDELSRERVRDEFIQILEEDRPDRVIQRMQELGILISIHPKMELTKEIEEDINSVIDIFAWFETLSGERVKRWLIRLLLLLEDLGRDEVEEFCQEYRFSREEEDSIIKGRLEAEKIIEKLKSSEAAAPSSIYYLLQPLPREVLLFAMAKAKKKIVKKRIFLFLSRLEGVKTKVDGDDLKRIGYKPSPEFKEILEEVKKVKLDGLLTTKKEEIDYIKSKFPRGEKQ